jgi:hypothetical protein
MDLPRVHMKGDAFENRLISGISTEVVDIKHLVFWRAFGGGSGFVLRGSKARRREDEKTGRRDNYGTAKEGIK